MFWNPQDLLLMMGTEIFEIDASWAEKLTETRVQFLMTPTVNIYSSCIYLFYHIYIHIFKHEEENVNVMEHFININAMFTLT